MRLQKPSSLGSGQRIQILLHAEGEHALTVRYSMLATRTSVSGSAAFGSISNTSAAWQQLDNGTYAFYGLHILWDRPPSSDAELDLDADSSRFAAEKTFVLDFAADCHGTRPCAQDGDTFETVLSVATWSDQAELRSAVTVTAVVESMLSCEHSKVWVELDVRSVPQSSAIRVHLKAYDVDNLPVAQTRAEVEFRFGGQALPVQWSRGSNETSTSTPQMYPRTSRIVQASTNSRSRPSAAGRSPAAQRAACSSAAASQSRLIPSRSSWRRVWWRCWC